MGNVIPNFVHNEEVSRTGLEFNAAFLTKDHPGHFEGEAEHVIDMFGPVVFEERLKTILGASVDQVLKPRWQLKELVT